MTYRQHSVYEHIFGPVPSRRLGMSLGVDLVPHKTCTLDCIYCECGKTTCLTIQRKEYVPTARVESELDAVLSSGPNLDFITFSGSGEPTLHSGIAEVIGFIKRRHPMYRVALLTNGTLLNDPGVREEIHEADLVKVSVDAVSQENFYRLNRPHPGLDLSSTLDGINIFRKHFEGRLWVEIFLLPGFNDSESELFKLKQVLNSIVPDKIQLNTLDRPGVDGRVKPLDRKALKEIAAYLNDAAIIQDFQTGQKTLTFNEDPYKLILSTIKRRPCTAEDVSKSLGIQMSKVSEYLDTLVENGEVGKKDMQRGVFYMMRNEVCC
ncbi:radical SAM protein [Thermodesulfobacteriota bacterium]